jgi:hypothetical protein
MQIIELERDERYVETRNKIKRDEKKVWNGNIE